MSLARDMDQQSDVAHAVTYVEAIARTMRSDARVCARHGEDEHSRLHEDTAALLDAIARL